MLKKIIIPLLLSSYTLLAYDVGDTLSKDITSKLSMKKDTVYAVNFFASWCKSCKHELPLIADAYNNGLTHIIAINADKDNQKAKDFVKKLNLPFPVIYDTEQTLISEFKPIGFPSLYYIKNAKVLKVLTGAVSHIDKQLTKDMKELK